MCTAWGSTRRCHTNRHFSDNVLFAILTIGEFQRVFALFVYVNCHKFWVLIYCVVELSCVHLLLGASKFLHVVESDCAVVSLLPDKCYLEVVEHLIK